MIAYLVGLELRSRFRARGLLTVGVLLLALLGLSTWIGVQRVQAFEAERAAASTADRKIWVEQGADNPHAAAHFSRYAFKPVPILGLFDPGALDTAGVAVWMEGALPRSGSVSESRGCAAWSAHRPILAGLGPRSLRVTGDHSRPARHHRR